MDWRIFYPWLKFAPQKFCTQVSTLFFLGKLKAPGTWGSVVGAFFSYYVLVGVSACNYILISAVLVYLAIGVCEIGERYFKERDPGKINLDEFVAMPICYFGIFDGINQSANLWLWTLAGFALFRFFDIVKPLGIKRIQNLSGGLGCVTDDVAAAFIVCAILNFARVIL